MHKKSYSRKLISHSERPMAEINVIPYIDVMLVLLIIFMVTTPLLSQGVAVQLPQAPAKVLSAAEKEPFIISIDKQGNYFLNIGSSNETPLSEQQLLTRVAAQLKYLQENKLRPTVLVKGDREINYGKVVQVMALLQKAGVENVGLVTESFSH